MFQYHKILSLWRNYLLSIFFSLRQAFCSNLASPYCFSSQSFFAFFLFLSLIFITGSHRSTSLNQHCRSRMVYTPTQTLEKVLLATLSYCNDIRGKYINKNLLSRIEDGQDIMLLNLMTSTQINSKLFSRLYSYAQLMFTFDSTKQQPAQLEDRPVLHSPIKKSKCNNHQVIDVGCLATVA